MLCDNTQEMPFTKMEAQEKKEKDWRVLVKNNKNL